LELKVSSTGKDKINNKKSIKLTKASQLKKRLPFSITKIKKDSCKVIGKRQENKKKKKDPSGYLLKRTD